MALCLRHVGGEEPSLAPPTSTAKALIRHKKTIGTLHRSTPYYHRDILGLPQHQNLSQSGPDKDEAVPVPVPGGAEGRQALSLVVNRFPIPIVHPSDVTTVAGLLSVFSRNEAIKIQAKYKSDAVLKPSDPNPSLPFRGFSERENNNDEMQPKRFCTQLHMACKLANPSPFVNRLLAEGASVHQVNGHGQTPLHLLVLGGTWNPSIKEAIDCLLWRGSSLTCTDAQGDTALLTVKHLLREHKFEAACNVTKCLLEGGADVDAFDAEDQTLLSYSLQHLDNAVELSKTLFNYGASVWGSDAPGGDDSAFKWLLKGIMRQRKLMNCSRTLKLIGQLMSNKPSQMEHLVIRTMTRHSRCYQVYGPLFLGIQIEMKKFWTEPQRLSHLCRLSIRESLTQSPSDSIALLRLPKIIERFILWEDSSPVSD